VPASELPQFRCHAAPDDTGAFGPTNAVCTCCNEYRGWAYAGPTYGKSSVGVVCPWCIASGAAAEKFAVEFIDAVDVPARMSPESLRELTTRTPGTLDIARTDRPWPFHCADAMRFLGGFNQSDQAAAYEQVRERLEREKLNLPVGVEPSIESFNTHVRRYWELMRPHWNAPLRFDCLHCGARIEIPKTRR
jgi:uncharacterized protein CbrC (UPF0167 family)